MLFLGLESDLFCSIFSCYGDLIDLDLDIIHFFFELDRYQSGLDLDHLKLFLKLLPLFHSILELIVKNVSAVELPLILFLCPSIFVLVYSFFRLLITFISALGHITFVSIISTNLCFSPSVILSLFFIPTIIIIPNMYLGCCSNYIFSKSLTKQLK